MKKGAHKTDIATLNRLNDRLFKFILPPNSTKIC